MQMQGIVNKPLLDKLWNIMTRILLTQLAVIVIYMTAWYLVARALTRFDVADIAWGRLHHISIHCSVAVSERLNPGPILSWPLSLSGAAAVPACLPEKQGKAEDARTGMAAGVGKNANIRSFLQVFCSRVLLLIISLPVTSVIMPEVPPLRLGCCRTVYLGHGFLLKQ